MTDSELLDRYSKIKAELVQAARAASRRPEDITLIAVSKTHPAEAVEKLYRAGHRDFGENYVQELIEKAQTLRERGCADIRWHFIGHLQTNKVKALLPHVQAVHTVDSLKLGAEISKRWVALGKGDRLPVLLEVNVDEEASKSGVLPEAVLELAAAVRALPGLELRGLMCIPAPESGMSGRAFIGLREIAARIPGGKGFWLSMGMTQDFPVAIAQGATHVRIGTAIFGTRAG